MNLHRINGVADWEHTPVAEHNYWQRLAVSTHGMVTPGNLTSLAGFLISLAGIVSLFYEAYWFALLAILVGRCLDLLDGFLAEKTSTKSPLGELVDATVDKVITLAAVFSLYVLGLASGPLLLVLFAPQVLITVCTLIGRTQQVHLHPALTGKWSMALVWVVLLGLVLAHAGDFSTQRILIITAWIVAFTSAALAGHALWGYIRQIARD